MALNHQQLMLVFSYLAYVGFDLPALDCYDEEKNFERLKFLLETIPSLDKQWKIVWGPAIYSFPGGFFADNMMYVVQNQKAPNEYVIAIRGTNPVSVSNWIIEDFLVARQVKWKWARKSQKVNAKSFNPKISLATHIGLNVLTGRLKAKKNLPGSGTDIVSFFRQEIAKNPQQSLSISVTGHSLGGALSPTLALWLKDTQADFLNQGKGWDPEKKAKLNCVAFAGPSPGNKDFALYFDEQFQGAYQRVHNSLDIVTHAWNTGSLMQLFDLYEPRYKPNFVLKSFFLLLIGLSTGKGYTQLHRHTPPIEAQIFSSLPDYLSQAIYQHALSYLELLNVKDQVTCQFLENAIGASMNSEKLA